MNEVVRDLRGVCPFCCGWYETRHASVAILHSLPPCPRFVSLSVVDYLRAVRKRIDRT